MRRLMLWFHRLRYGDHRGFRTVVLGDFETQALNCATLQEEWRCRVCGHSMRKPWWGR